MTPPTADMWDSILSLMALIIMSDNEVRSNEIQSFVANAQSIALEVYEDTKITDESLKQWYVSKRKTLEAAIMSDISYSFMVSHIMILEDFEQKQSLLNSLIRISTSDGGTHPNEIEIINLAAAYWGLPPVNNQAVTLRV